MTGNKSQESQRLLDSVKEKYNDPRELELRIEDLKIGIREAEQEFVEKFPPGSPIAVLNDLRGNPQIDADRRRIVEQDDPHIESFKSFRVAIYLSKVECQVGNNHHCTPNFIGYRIIALAKQILSF